jgi:biotin carboxylase
MAKAEKIDGVFNAFDDFNTWQAQALCERLGLPHYATKEQLEICSNKDRFKSYCRRFGVPVIEEYNIEGLEIGFDSTALEFPVIVKPVDSYASQGITVCYGREELEKACAKARNRSKTEKVIVERFIDNSHGVEMYYTVKKGKVVLTAVTDRYVQKLSEGHPPLPTKTIFPSQHLNHYLTVLDGRMRNMIRGMGIENGVLFFQSLFEGGNFYLYEMGFRLSGEQHYQIIEKQTGINLLEMMLDLAVGEKLDVYPLEQLDNGIIRLPSCNLSVLLNEGTIKEIRGLEHILAMPEVLSFIQLKECGDRVEATGNYGQMLGRFNIVSGDLQGTLELINNLLEVISSDGQNLIASGESPSLVSA